MTSSSNLTRSPAVPRSQADTFAAACLCVHAKARLRGVTRRLQWFGAAVLAESMLARHEVNLIMEMVERERSMHAT
jgi:hypothetical protein